MPRMTRIDRDKLVARKMQLDARIKAFDAGETVRKRREETRAKIIFGALAMEHADSNPDSEFAAIMRRLLNRYVLRPADRSLFNLEERDTDDPQQKAG